MPVSPRTPAPPDLHDLAANTIRTLAMDAVQKANSGHPGMPMGMADVAVVLWTEFMRHNPADPKWPNRDRFVLSAGHGSMLLYSLLHLTGYDLPLEQLEQFRQYGSLTPGHPEFGLTAGIETTTGPLGQGISNAVGMALAERWLATRYNRPGFDIVDHTVYVIASDGDLQEGVSHESCSLAGHLGLGRLIVLYDDNNISIDGPTSLSFSEDVLTRFSAYGWHVQRVDGHNPAQVREAIQAAHAETSRPSIIACQTHIGYGSPNKQGSAKAHGEPLGADEVKLTKERFGWPVDKPFYVPEEARTFMAGSAVEAAKAETAWNELFTRYTEAHPELAAEFKQSWEGELPDGWDRDLPTFGTDKPLATRAASGQVLAALWERIPWLIGGSGDLTPSNNTKPGGSKAITRDDFSGRYIHFGVREHGMGSIMNGMAVNGGVRVYGGTFLVFSDYMRGSIRLAALMEAPVIYVFTHDSIGVGEDGPTHQPVEHVASLRAMPFMTVIRPADANETRVAWQLAIAHQDGPVALVLTRQALPVLDRSMFAPAEDALRGAYVLADVPDPDVILIGTGSEVHLAIAAKGLLAEKGIQARVVSMPCQEVFNAQTEEYREQVLPGRIRARVAVEAGTTFGWHKYVGLDGAVVGLDRFGESAPYAKVYQELGLTPEAVADAAEQVVARVGRGAPRELAGTGATT